MTSPHPVFTNILHQPEALAQSIAYHSGPGQPALLRAADVIEQAVRQNRPIALVAIGASYSGSLPFVIRMAGAGVRVGVEDSAEFVHYTHKSYAEPAVFLVVSRSGATIENTRALDRLKGRGHTVIGITNEPQSPLAQQADLALIFGGPSDDLIAVQTYLTTLLTMDFLAEAVEGRLGRPAAPDSASPPSAAKGSFSDQIRHLPDLAARTIGIYQEKSREWRADIEAFSAVYLLGRGAAMSSVTEGSLLFHEMARFPGVPFGAGSFRHGAWEVVDSRLRTFVFAPADPTYDLNLALAEDLAHLGARTALISAQSPADLPEKLEFWPIPQTEARFAPYLEIIPLQFFTYELALRQGLTPGNFRAASPVILSETGRARQS